MVLDIDGDNAVGFEIEFQTKTGGIYSILPYLAINLRKYVI